MRFFSASLAGLAFAVAGPAAATTYTLDFSGTICEGSGGLVACGSGAAISLSYGDTAIVDVSHGQDTAGPTSPLSWWNTGYSDLSEVAWGGSTSTDVSAFVRLIPAAGYELSLLSFQLGAWTRVFTTPVSVLDSLGALIEDFGDWEIPFPDSSTFAGPWTSADGIEIRWGAPWWVAIDNITFSVTPINGNGGGGNGGGGNGGGGVSPIPLPATAFLLLLAGLLGLGLGIVGRRQG